MAQYLMADYYHISKFKIFNLMYFQKKEVIANEFSKQILIHNLFFNIIRIVNLFIKDSYLIFNLIINILNKLIILLYYMVLDKKTKRIKIFFILFFLKTYLINTVKKFLLRQIILSHFSSIFIKFLEFLLLQTARNAHLINESIVFIIFTLLSDDFLSHLGRKSR